MQAIIFYILISYIDYESNSIELSKKKLTMIYHPSFSKLKFSGNKDSIIIDDRGFVRNYKEGWNGILQYKNNLEVDRCYKDIKASFKIAFSKGYLFTRSIQKLPLGFYGGFGCISGGCSNADRDGYSVRLVTKNGLYGIYVYDKNSNNNQYGELYLSNTSVDSNEEGYIEVELINKNSNPIYSLKYNFKKILEIKAGKNASIRCFKGLIFTDMHGGKEKHTGTIVKRNQSVRYYDYSLHLYN